MSIRDAARASGLSPKALRRRIERGTLGSVLVGGRRRIPVDDLVRRGLVADRSASAVEDSPTEAHDPVAMARRLRALESRVAALESVLDGAARPPKSATGRRDALMVVADAPPARVAADPAAITSPSR